MIRKRRFFISLPLTITLLFCGCFPFGNQQRTIAGTYQLVKFEDGKTYYIYAEDQKDNGGGVIDGTVKLIGWNAEYIIALRHSNYRGDPDGWMVINLQSGSIEGPFSYERIAGRSDIASIRTMSPDVAWERL